MIMFNLPLFIANLTELGFFDDETFTEKNNSEEVKDRALELALEDWKLMDGCEFTPQYFIDQEIVQLKAQLEKEEFDRSVTIGENNWVDEINKKIKEGN